MRLCWLLAAQASAYQLPSLLRNAPRFVRSAVPIAMEEDIPDLESSGWSEEQKRRYLDEVNLGTEGGGWDNDEYLASTKANPPVTSNVELLRQAEAYIKMLASRSMSPKPEYQVMIEELKAKMTPDEIAEAQKPRPVEPQRQTAPVTPVSIPPAPVMAPPPPVVTTNPSGVTSGSSYAAVLNQVGTSGKAQVPAPMPPPAAIAPPATSSSPSAMPMAPSGVEVPSTLQVMGTAADIVSGAPLPSDAVQGASTSTSPAAASLDASNVMSGMSYASLSEGAARPPAAAASSPPVQTLPQPQPPPPAPAPANAAPLPDKDPRDLRRQYKMYMQTCASQERQPAQEILDMVTRLYAEKPPTETEADDIAEIR